MAAALSALGVRPAVGFSLQTVPTIRWGRGVVTIGSSTLRNDTGAAAQFPFEPTLVRWEGDGWRPQPCSHSDTSGPIHHLCKVMNINAQPLPPGTISSPDTRLAFFWAPNDMAPGTYAIVIPIWRTDEPTPDVEPSEAVAAIVTVTP